MVWENGKSLAPTGLEPSTIQPATSHNTDYTIRAPFKQLKYNGKTVLQHLQNHKADNVRIVISAPLLAGFLVQVLLCPYH